MKILLQIVILLFSISSFGIEGFYNVDSEVALTGHFDIDSILRSVQKTPSNCTLFRTSNEGYGFTAKHCVKRCFLGNRVTKKNCSDLPIGVELIAVGKTSPEKQKKTSEALKNDLNKIHYDYALIKTSDSFENSHCLKISEHFTFGENVWGLGYPKNLVKSSVVFLSSKYFIDRKNGNNPSIEGDLKFVFGQLLNNDLRDYIFETTTDGTSGLSGGPLLNQYGQVLALASFVNGPKLGPYIKDGHTHYISLNHIMDELIQIYPHQFVASVFDCH